VQRLDRHANEVSKTALEVTSLIQCAGAPRLPITPLAFLHHSVSVFFAFAPVYLRQSLRHPYALLFADRTKVLHFRDSGKRGLW
jgi:hypothetical protein